MRGLTGTAAIDLAEMNTGDAATIVAPDGGTHHVLKTSDGIFVNGQARPFCGNLIRPHNTWRLSDTETIYVVSWSGYFSY
jgi:hypothetical protein